MKCRHRVFFLASLCLSFAFNVGAAEWRQCEKAKLRQLDLEQTRREASPARKRKHSRQHGERSHDSVESLDEWLWKNCREYSYELRTLEQQRM